MFGTLGNTGFPLTGCEIKYLQVNTGCAHTFSSWKVTTAATCIKAGSESRTCSQCGEKETRVLEATGHKYTSKTYGTTCQTFAHTCYTCSNCGDTYNVYADEAMSEWQTTKPNMDADLIETATQYRSSQYQTVTSFDTTMDGYETVSSQWIKHDSGVVNYVNSWPSGFDTANSLYKQYNNKSQKVSASTSDTTKVVVDSDKVAGYLYYHWCYSGYPYTSAVKTGSYNRFHAYYSTSAPSTANASDSSDDSYRFDSSTACSDSKWYFYVPVYAQNYTTYKNQFTYGRWGTPSDWSLTPIEAADDIKVETRTVYRYVTGELAKHNYVNNVCTVCGQEKPVVDFYLFGYINGANYGCEEDFSNMGTYKFQAGRLTAKFDQDSYVGVKTTNNSDWYMTSGWQGNGVTSVTLYNTESINNADKLYVPGGVELIFTLVDNGNDTLILSYEMKQCVHNYKGTVTRNPDCLNAGVKTFTCTECGDTYTESISATGHSMNTVVTKPTCTNAGYTVYTCKTCGYSYTGDRTTALGHSYSTTIVPNTCTESGHTLYTCAACGHSYTADQTPATGHNYQNGSCTNCGATDPNYAASYYLVGYINGADYGCEGDYANMGQYKFVNGKLTVTFNQDSYVFLKTEGNTKWFMAQSYCTDTTAILYNTETGASEKMRVPGNVEITFTLTENTNGTVTLSYATAASVKPTLTLKSPTLEFKDMITVNAFFTAENIQDVVEMGMITYKNSVAQWNVETADHVIPGTTYDENTGRYIAHSQGIHAKYLGDTVYLACYAKLTDGSYVYTSKLAPYSPVQYATSQLKNSSDVKLKQLVAAMLNYGAEAQLFFGHNVENLANASLTAQQKALPEAYREDMAGTVPTASTAKQGSFANNSGFSKRYPAISFEGAFCINYFFTPKYTPVGDITLYYWNAEDFNAVSVLTTANASGSMKLEQEASGEYRGDIVGISAKNLSGAVYVAAVYSDGTTTWTSGVLGYSIGAYCSGQSSKGAAVAALAEATAVYGYHAKAYFG